MCVCHVDTIKTYLLTYLFCVPSLTCTTVASNYIHNHVFRVNTTSCFSSWIVFLWVFLAERCNLYYTFTEAVAFWFLTARRHIWETVIDRDSSVIRDHVWAFDLYNDRWCIMTLKLNSPNASAVTGTRKHYFLATKVWVTNALVMTERAESSQVSDWWSSVSREMSWGYVGTCSVNALQPDAGRLFQAVRKTRNESWSGDNYLFRDIINRLFHLICFWTV